MLERIYFLSPLRPLNGELPLFTNTTLILDHTSRVPQVSATRVADLVSGVGSTNDCTITRTARVPCERKKAANTGQLVPEKLWWGFDFPRTDPTSQVTKSISLILSAHKHLLHQVHDKPLTEVQALHNDHRAPLDHRKHGKRMYRKRS